MSNKLVHWLVIAWSEDIGSRCVLAGSTRFPTADDTVDQYLADMSTQVKSMDMLVG